MSDLRELYQQVIMDHNKSPRNFKKIEQAKHQAEGHNPLCGDQCAIYLQIENDRIQDIGFQGSGCAISKASASIMTAVLKGSTLQEAETFFNSFHKIVTGEITPGTEETEGKNRKLAAFYGVRDFPARVKCATLAWHTFKAALKSESENQKVTTE
ncbi:MAG: Fe-S cluster assembly sulfur transfer protein SufU [Planctomycetota bacterium]